MIVQSDCGVNLEIVKQDLTDPKVWVCRRRVTRCYTSSEACCVLGIPALSNVSESRQEPRRTGEGRRSFEVSLRDLAEWMADTMKSRPRFFDVGVAVLC